jgi:heptosyltransferase-2
MKSVLMIELWGMGDATIATSALQGLLAQDWDVTVLAKPQTCAFLQSQYPRIKTVEFDAPWTAFYGKYRFARWPWAQIFRVLARLRQKPFDAALSVRSDPRDHMLMWLGGVKRRIGFSTRWSRWLLNEPIMVRDPNAHRVEDWWKLQDRLTGSPQRHFPPRLVAEENLVTHYRSLFAGDSRPVIALHCGARIAVRRWPEAYYRQLILSLRQKFNFQLALIPDPDGYGSSLQDLADHTFAQLTLAELLALLSCASQVICNDSGPCHLAAALDIPVIVFFGPQRPELFRPFGDNHLVVIRDLCVYRPCSDYCRFPEPYCLTRLTPELAWPEVENHLILLQKIPLKPILIN